MQFCSCLFDLPYEYCHLRIFECTCNLNLLYPHYPANLFLPIISLLITSKVGSNYSVHPLLFTVLFTAAVTI